MSVWLALAVVLSPVSMLLALLCREMQAEVCSSALQWRAFQWWAGKGLRIASMAIAAIGLAASVMGLRATVLA
ncbi:hypothetical protein [Ottowia sp.]|uniref:hypothetical protein n=1 Tax=Ottowia sp. TaxID=1898956 RepID=UPI0025E40DDD|nr:hypothetical protein [Ottowia sp.]MBK6616547.1 hypothetical protein [Ottowia sp.]